MKQYIKNRFTGKVLFEFEVNDSNDGMITRHIIEEAIRSGADLCGADLFDANLRGADLCGANLRDADLRDADLCGADLCGADLCDADLCGADLCGANLRGADLRDADLRGAKNAPLIINGFNWNIIISGIGEMRIGCQYHSVDTWKNFTDEEISRMDSRALVFWNKNKAMLLSICDCYKHD
jgi:hypothetical protein